MAGRRPVSSAVVPSRKRGRPTAAVFSPEDAAQLLAVSPAMVRRALALGASSFFPGAKEQDGDWTIPERDLRALLGPGLPPLLTVKAFAQLISKSADWVYDLVQRGVIRKREICGSIRIPSDEYWRLPAQMPAAIPARPFSFLPRGQSVTSAEEVEG